MAYSEQRNYSPHSFQILPQEQHIQANEATQFQELNFLKEQRSKIYQSIVEQVEADLPGQALFLQKMHNFDARLDGEAAKLGIQRPGVVNRIHAFFAGGFALRNQGFFGRTFLSQPEQIEQIRQKYLQNPNLLIEETYREMNGGTFSVPISSEGTFHPKLRNQYAQFGIDPRLTQYVIDDLSRQQIGKTKHGESICLSFFPEAQVHAIVDMQYGSPTLSDLVFTGADAVAAMKYAVLASPQETQQVIPQLNQQIYDQIRALSPQDKQQFLV